jgi:dihydroflavonol-4-reductase
MRVLVTGGTGFVGSHAVKALHAAGHDLRLMARNPARAEKQFADDGLAITDTDAAASIEIVQGDITDEASVRAAMIGCDAVVHAAAVVGIDGAKAVAASTTNERGARIVLGTAADLGLDPIVYISSVSALFRPGGPVLLTADTPVAPATSPYAESKAACERYARQMQADGHPVVCIYPGGILGPDDPGLSEAMRAALIWRRLTMADLNSGFPLVDVRDVAAVIAAAMQPGKGARRYLAGHYYIRWRDLGAMVAKVTGRPVRLPPMPGAVLRTLGRAGDVVRRVVPFSFPLSHEAMETATQMVPTDDQPTVDELGITFRPPEETLRDAYRWLYESGHLAAHWVPALAK